MRISDWSSDVCSSDLLEIIEPDQGEMAGKVAALALDPDGPPLSEKLNESARAQYVSAMAKAGLPWQAVKRFKPWKAGITLAIMPLGTLGFEANSGAEKPLTATGKSAAQSIGAMQT